MTDMTKYTEIYKELKGLNSDEFIQIIINSKTKEEKDFYTALSNIVLQENQKQAIERGLF